jgi:hypothetical protein
MKHYVRDTRPIGPTGAYMRPTYRSPKDRVLRIGKDHWSVLAMVLLVAGGLFALLGLLPQWGWEAAAPFPQALVAWGVSCLCAGAWVIMRRPGEIVIDPAERTIRLRDPIRELRFSFRDVAYIEILLSPQPLVVAGAPPLEAERYNVGFRIIQGTQLTVLRGLELSTARLKAQNLAAIMGRPIRRG